jgi:hypothetical protein
MAIYLRGYYRRARWNFIFGGRNMLRYGRLLLAVVLLALAGCSTSSVSLDYSRAAAPANGARPQVAVGAFTDQRRSEDPRRLGAIRNGYGAAQKTLVLSDDAIVVVQKAFTEALDKRGLLAASGSARYTLTGVINKLDCNQYVRREAHVEIVVSLTDNATGKLVLQQTGKSVEVQDPSSLFDTSILASPDDLRAVAEKALEDAIDDALASPPFVQAMAG